MVEDGDNVELGEAPDVVAAEPSSHTKTAIRVGIRVVVIVVVLVIAAVVRAGIFDDRRAAPFCDGCTATLNPWIRRMPDRDR